MRNTKKTLSILKLLFIGFIAFLAISVLIDSIINGANI